MIYLLSQTMNSFDMLTFDMQNAVGVESISQGFRIGTLDDPIRYAAKSKTFLKKLGSLHFIESASAPMLVSGRLRRAIDRAAPNEVEFLPASIVCGDQEVFDYSVINILSRANCVDMEKSEYEQTNFDPADPHYMFRYTVLFDNFGSDISIALSADQENQIVVGEGMRAACIAEGLKGLTFYTALDMTYGGRTVGYTI